MKTLLLACMMMTAISHADITPNELGPELYLTQGWLDKNGIAYEKHKLVQHQTLGMVYVIKAQEMQTMPMPIKDILIKYVKTTDKTKV